MLTRREAIQNFLTAKVCDDPDFPLTPEHLRSLYHPGMEVQVNVAQDDGERIDGDYKGKHWHGWTDGQTTWKSFRIPFGAGTKPHYEDGPMKFSLQDHAEGIGLTGWDFESKVSRWFAYDFDAIVGHSDKHAAKLNPDELERVKQTALDIPWVTVQRSTSGTGLHLFVFLEKPEPTANHTEHAALARAILGKMSALTGFDFASQVDICGANIWLWHRKLRKAENGLGLITQGDTLTEVPLNWRDHVDVISRKRIRATPGFVKDNPKQETEWSFEDLIGQRTKVTLDDRHQALIDWLNEKDCLWWWDADMHMLVCHTADLKRAHEELGMIGLFDTAAEGKEQGSDQNCFAFPLRRGAWAVRRHTPGVTETSSWDQDSSGWTRTFLNKEPDLRTAARTAGGIESPDGSFSFRTTEDVDNAIKALGSGIKYPNYIAARPAKLKRHKDGRLLVEIPHEARDMYDDMEGWLMEKKSWRKLLSTQVADPNEPDVANYDDFVRHVVTEGHEDSGWMLHSDHDWTHEALTHVKAALKSQGNSAKEIDIIVGTCVIRSWMEVNRPFEPEYPGDRRWNRKAAQLAYALLTDTDLVFPTWTLVLKHCSAALDEAVAADSWCRSNGVLTGLDYLTCWVASLIQEPLEPLPYLFMYGPQNSGKSIFHEALSLLFNPGYERADKALTSEQGFNGELIGRVLCVIEETDLSQNNKSAYNKIKDWVTSKDILIHKKGQTPYTAQNSTHWVQCANDYTACPIFPGDTRITMIHVPPLSGAEIPKKELLALLKREAPHFLTHVATLDLPKVISRLNIPVIVTQDKLLTEQLNENRLEQFLRASCEEAPGYAIRIKDLVDTFHKWLRPDEVDAWSSIKVGRNMPPYIAKGRHFDKEYGTNDWWYGNLKWIEEGPCKQIAETLLVRIGENLKPSRTT